MALEPKLTPAEITRAAYATAIPAILGMIEGMEYAHDSPANEIRTNSLWLRRRGLYPRFACVNPRLRPADVGMKAVQKQVERDYTRYAPPFSVCTCIAYPYPHAHGLELGCGACYEKRMFDAERQMEEA